MRRARVVRIEMDANDTRILDNNLWIADCLTIDLEYQGRIANFTVSGEPSFEVKEREK